MATCSSTSSARLPAAASLLPKHCCNHPATSKRSPKINSNSFPLPKQPLHIKESSNSTSEKSGLGLRLSKALTATALAATLLSSSLHPSLYAFAAETDYSKYYGTAGSAANYGGYGGNARKKDSAEYSYDVPRGWKERLVSKIQKGTNGTDSEFYNPKRKDEKEYLTSLPGFRTLAPKDTVLNDLALSDVSLQDMITSADNIKSKERRLGDTNQLYYDFEIDSPVGHGLIAVCSLSRV
eukprot:TRINITY_DN4546_c0_g1_i1.p1 TRINITY_DN4546_c0_g1~~TRINITY_DN4546_c0_g1_i1.p1  ORF type:complete len:238 (+),score=10.43 TRINITY_DN4546_c0_g1_i1:142-855(+)